MDNWGQLNSEIVACRKCPRLVRYREHVAREKRRAFREWEYWGRPITGFGDPNARVVIVGLAPGAHGGNRTGRIFTGDGSGTTLTAALYRAGFANQPTSIHAYDGLELRNAFITAIVRCVPPGNKPAPREEDNCRPYLAREFALLNQARIVIALGRIACDGYLRLLREQGRRPRGPWRGKSVPRVEFKHGAVYPLGDSLPTLICSYHPSRQNTQTGRLTEAMLDAVFQKAKEALKGVNTTRGREPYRL